MNRPLTISTLIFVLILAVNAEGQNYNPFNQRDDTYTLLGLKRAKQAYETARSEYERQEELHERGHISDIELERARNLFTDAEVNYQQSLLAVLFEEQYITVSQAVKFQGDDGSKRVRLTLENTSGGSAEFRKLIDMEDELFRTLQPDVIPNVYVSIINDDNAIISDPYEAKIAELDYGEPVTLEFGLLQDLDAVTVFLIYGNGNQRTMKIFLQKDESVDRVLVQSEQFSQEVELGSTTSYDLSLELFSGTSNTFSLEVINLPRQIGRFFKDPGGNVRLTQVKFTESSQSKNAALEITLPDRPGENIRLNQPIEFFVLVVPPDQLEAVRSIDDANWSEEKLAEMNIGYVRLEVVPRGKGEILVRMPQLYHAIDAGQSARTSVELVNEGSHRLDNIEVRLDLPLGWRYTIDPTRIAALEIGDETHFELTLTPPEDVAPGKYNVRVRTSALSGGEPISAEDKTITVEINVETNLFSTVLIVMSLLGLVTGIVIYGIRLSKK